MKDILIELMKWTYAAVSVLMWATAFLFFVSDLDVVIYQLACWAGVLFWRWQREID